MTNSNKDKINTVLVAPLNWGLGHATRCIPIIKELLAGNCRVIIAGEGKVMDLLKQEFPRLQTVTLKGVTVKYPAGKKGFLFKMLGQLPGALLSVYKERSWLKKAIDKYGIDAVIADNRMGLHNKKIPCIYITHQLHIKTEGGRWMDTIAQSLHYHFINKFNQCWVPDFEDDKINLAGELSHPQKKPTIPVKYIGALSRFEKLAGTEKQYDYAIILSGPEPQRTILENLLLEQIKTVDGKFLLVRGLPDTTTTLSSSNNVTVINHLSSGELNKAIQSSGLIISRSGYTTVMDLIKLNKKAVLIPTPGQTEQEYLANHLLANKIFYTTKQDGFVLKEQTEAANSFSQSNTINESAMEKYKAVVKGFVSLLKRQ